MFKNIIIIFLFFLLCSLLIQKPDNAKLLIKDLATSKEMVIDGTEYIKKTFDREFTAVEDKVSGFQSFEQNKAAVSNVFIKEQTIVEDTWFNDK